jgi:hypothetical protein
LEIIAQVEQWMKYCSLNHLNHSREQEVKEKIQKKRLKKKSEEECKEERRGLKKTLGEERSSEGER